MAEVLEVPETELPVHPELVNLAEELSEEELGEIAAAVIEDFKSDAESRQEWMTMHADWIKLYFQKDVPVNAPWEGSSDESVPMLAEACNQFHARAFQAMFPNRRIITAIPVGKADSAAKERAERVGQHMSWQLMVKDKRYKKNKDRLLLSTPLHGSCFTKTYRCPVRKRNITENVRAVDLVVPYGTGPRDLEDIERKTHVLYMPMNRAQKLHSQGFFIEEPVPWEEGYNDDGVNEVDQAHNDATGIQEGTKQNTEEPDGKYAKIYEQHRFWDLDDDGVAEPYITWVDATSEQCLRVAIRYDTDEAGNPTDDKEPVEYFTHYPFLENPDGFYGLGFGHLIGQLNIAVNKMLRQTIDAATLANVGNLSGFVNKGAGVSKGELQFQLGKFVGTESSVEDLSRSFFQFKFPGPQPALLDAATLLMGRSDRLATVTEALTGQTDKVMQPTALLALIEQSLQVFSTVYERILGAWELELDKHYRLNRKFMDPEEYFSVLDITGKVKDYATSREDYEEDFQVKPIADPKMSTERQKLAKAEAEYNAALQNPLIVNNPIAFYNASRRYFEAIGSENMDEILPKPTQNLPRVDDPGLENMGALSPVPMVPPVYPDQDHQLHIQAHMALMNDPVYGVRLSDYGRQELQAHINAHTAFMYGQVESDGLGTLEASPGIEEAVVGIEGPVQSQQGLGGGNLMGADPSPQGTSRGPGLPGQVP